MIRTQWWRYVRKSVATPRTAFRLLGRLVQLEDRVNPNGLLVSINDLATIPASPTGKTPAIQARSFRPVAIDTATVLTELSAVPSEPAYLSGADGVEFVLPAPDGTAQRFEVVDAPVMAPELAARFPDIRTFQGRGLDDPTALLRMDVTPLGFHAQVISSAGTWLIDPFYHLEDDVYASYYRKDALTAAPPADGDADGAQAWGTGRKSPGCQCSTCMGAMDVLGRGTDGGSGSSSTGDVPQARSGTQLRTYRLAVAATGEYTAIFGGTQVLGQAAIVTAVNRVTGVYESELSIRLNLVANNSLLVYTNPATDPYTNNDPVALLTQNQANVDAVIGSANYDIGHVFSTAGGGLAGLGVVGFAGVKAQGETGLPNPVGDPFHIDYVAHEIGHQFGARHTFNTSSDPNRNQNTAFEPGSGSTIMGYAGITGPNSDLQPNSDPFFNTSAFDEIVNFVDAVIPGVGTRTANGNVVPTVVAGPTYVIPARTPFELVGGGSDANGDAVTYSWEQRDLGPAQLLTAADNGTSPLFRVYNPTPSPARVFPRLTDLVNNTDTIPLGEKLPTVNRAQMRFRLTARDNRIGGGGVNTADTFVQVVNTGAAFAVTSPNVNLTWVHNTTETVTWDVAGTNAGLVNAQNVNISLSTDGGLTYPTLLAGNVPNTGSANVVVPVINTGTARVRVQPVGNVFFDISNANFTISPVAPTFAVSGKLYEDWTGNGTPDALDKPLGNQVVLFDTNGNGVLDTATTSSGTVNIAIPDANPTGITSTIAVSGLPAKVLDVNVKLNIEHTYVGDLRVFLTGPNNAKISLILNRGDEGINFTNTVLDDEALVSITAIAAAGDPFSGSFRPEVPLGNFDGTPANGNWTLAVIDSVGLDTGKLVDWSLTFTTEQATTSLGNGFYGINGLDIGTYNVTPLGGLNFVTPPTGKYGVTITSPFDEFPNRDFYVTKQKAFYGLAIDDANKDGVFDAGEPGLSGVQIYIDTNKNGAFNVGEPTTTTDALGRYQFTSRPVGMSVLRQVVPNGRFETFPAAGGITVNQVGTESQLNNNFGSRLGFAPVIVSNGGGPTAAVSVFENAATVTTVVGDDPDPGTVLTYSLAGGADAGKFTINPATGKLAFSPAANFEVPTDANADNAYEVIVQVSDGSQAATQLLTVTVNDVNEAPAFTVGPNPISAEDAGPQALAFLAGVATGPNPEPGQTVTFTVAVIGTTGTLAFTSIPAIDAAGNLTYTAAPNTSGTATVTVFATDDGGTANGGSDTSTTKTFTITVATVNDAPTFVVGADQTAGEDKGQQTVPAFIATKSAGPPDEAGQTISFLASNDNAALFAVAPAIAANGTLTYTPAANAFGVAVVTVTAKDSGGTANGGVDTSAPQTFTITVGNVNDAPTFAVGAAQSLLEDAAPQVVPNFLTNVTAGPANESAQAVSFVVTTNNPALFAAAPAIDSTGTLTYTLAPNANGTATVTVTAKDDGGTAGGGSDTSSPQTFLVTVTGVNDAPTFAVGANPTSNEDAGTQTVAGFAAAVAAGPPDEAGQQVTFTVTTDNPALFLIAPAVAPNGTLTYTANPNANGTATVTVTAKDSGGTANGGANQSTVQTFTVTVVAVNDAPTFAVGAAQAVMGDAGPQAVANFASAISAGPVDEGGQSVSFQVTADNPALFAELPTIDAAGVLRYTPAPLTNGVATVTVTAVDDGPGAAASAPRTFTVGVTSFLDPVVASATTNEDTMTGGLVLGTGLAGSPVTHFQITNVRGGVLFRPDGTTFVSNGDFIPVGDGAAGLRFLPLTNANDNTSPGGFGFDVRNSTSASAAGLVRSATTATVSVVPVNDAPTLSVGAGVTVSEDAAAQAVANFVSNASAGPPDEAGQPLAVALSVAVTSGDVSFVQPPVLDLATGMLAFRAAPDSNGVATVTATLSDGSGGTATQTFIITVTPVNDPPTAALPATTAKGGAGPQVVPGFVALSTGAANEADPLAVTVTIVSTTGNIAFTTPPAVDANGTLTYTAKRGSIGTANLGLVVSDGATALPVRFVTLDVDAAGRFELVGYTEFAVGSDDGQPDVTFYNADRSVRFLSKAFPGTEFGARIASADFTGDGIADVVVGSGVGRSTFVQVIDGSTQRTIFAVQPFEAAFTGGVYVAAGDVTGDRIADLVITPDRGGGPRVRVFDGVGFNPIADFFGIDDPNFRGGARAAVGDLNADKAADLVVAAGFGGGPRVAGFDGRLLAAGKRVKLFNDFFAFEQTLRNGVFVAVGDIDGDGVSEIIAGGGPNGGPRVQAFDGRTLVSSGGATLTPTVNFFAGDPQNRGGIRVAVKDLDGDTQADLVVGAGTNAGSVVTAYLGTTLAGDPFLPVAFAFEAFDDFTGGVFVG
jgi:subtilisin-like proprotein convertase family protein